MRRPEPRRFEMVFVFDRSRWVLRDAVEAHHVFRLGDRFYVACEVAGDLVIARPHHHWSCLEEPEVRLGEEEGRR